MKVLFVSAEVAPLAKVGGLADVAGSLPLALKALGHDVRIVMPDYGMIEASGEWPIIASAQAFNVAVGPGWVQEATVRHTMLQDVPVYLLGTNQWFQDADRSEAIYRPGIDQYLFFSSAVLQMLMPIEWSPEVIHCHDWHTGFVPALMRERHPVEMADIASVFTIHNLAYQGEFDTDVLTKLGLDHSLFTHDKLETWGRVNFLKAGCTYADQVNTVSENYALEVQRPEYGATLDGLMRHLADEGRFEGIVNGLDLEFFNPENDPALSAPYSAGNVSGKKACKKALMRELGLEEIPGAPLIGIVSRLSRQKGIDLITAAAKDMFELPIQLVVLGAGDPDILLELRQLEKRYPKHLKFVEGFHLELAPKIYAASDGFAMPSTFEPCGLGQMIAMRYGTIPVVRATGGLADTVTDALTGFKFDERSAKALFEAMRRLTVAYHDKKKWPSMIQAAMREDFSWDSSAVKYAALYERALCARHRLSLQRA